MTIPQPSPHTAEARLEAELAKIDLALATRRPLPVKTTAYSSWFQSDADRAADLNSYFNGGE